MSGLFIGLVTHPRTRFTESRSATGLTAQLADSLTATGLEVSTHVEDRDLAANRPDPSEDALADSRRRLVAVQREWASYCGRGQATLRLQQWISRQRGSIEPASALQARRLLNIELAHMELMFVALNSGAEFALIIEDDAVCSDTEALAFDLHEMLTRTNTPYMSHLSTSFSPSELGVSRLLEKSEIRWSSGGSEYRLSRPITNTVCATVYRRDFLTDLHRLWSQEQLVPVIPVDWRLNSILMRMHADGLLPNGYSSLVYPSPIIQRSLHS